MSSKKVEKVMFWIPRILAISFAVFISLFALDVFGAGYTFWESILGFLIHLIPTYLIIGAILIAWRFEILGGLIFIALGIFYIMMFWKHFDFITYLLISGPAFLTGGLFIAHHVIFKKKI